MDEQHWVNRYGTKSGIGLYKMNMKKRKEDMYFGVKLEHKKRVFKYDKKYTYNDIVYNYDMKLHPYGKLPQGRKIFDGADPDVVLSKCETVWKMGGTDGEAALFAGISYPCLAKFLGKNKDYRDHREHLRSNPVLKARTTVYNDLDNVDTAKWYLEKKKSSEFGKQEDKKEEAGINLIFQKVFNGYYDKVIDVRGEGAIDAAEHTDDNDRLDGKSDSVRGVRLEDNSREG